MEKILFAIAKTISPIFTIQILNSHAKNDVYNDVHGRNSYLTTLSTPLNFVTTNVARETF